MAGTRVGTPAAADTRSSQAVVADSIPVEAGSLVDMVAGRVVGCKMVGSTLAVAAVAAARRRSRGLRLGGRERGRREVDLVCWTYRPSSGAGRVEVRGCWV